MPNVFVTSEEPVPALSSPQFLIKVGDIIYLTVGVWEYDPNNTDSDPEKAAGCATMAGIFDSITGNLVARQLSDEIEIQDGGGQTAPEK